MIRLKPGATATSGPHPTPTHPSSISSPHPTPLHPPQPTPPHRNFRWVSDGLQTPQNKYECVKGATSLYPPNISGHFVPLILLLPVHGALHCNENSKHIFPEMKLQGLVPNFYIHVSGSDLYIPMTCLIWNICFPVLHERTLSSTTGGMRRAGKGTAAKQMLGTVPCPLLRFYD